MHNPGIYDCPADHLAQDHPTFNWRFKSVPELEAHLIGCELAKIYAEFHTCKYETAHLFVCAQARDQHEFECCYKSRPPIQSNFNYRNPGYQEFQLFSRASNKRSTEHWFKREHDSKYQRKKFEPFEANRDPWKKQNPPERSDRNRDYHQYRKNGFSDWTLTNQQAAEKPAAVSSSTQPNMTLLNKRSILEFEQVLGKPASEAPKNTIEVDSLSPQKQPEFISFFWQDAIIMIEFKRLKSLSVTTNQTQLYPPSVQPKFLNGTLAHLRNTRLKPEVLAEFTRCQDSVHRVVGELYFEGDNRHIKEIHNELQTDRTVKFFFDADRQMFLVLCLREIESCKRLITFEDGLINQSIIVVHYPCPPSAESEWVELKTKEEELGFLYENLREETIAIEMELATVEREKAIAEEIFKLQQHVSTQANKLIQMDKSNASLAEAIKSLEQENDSLSDAIDQQDEENKTWVRKIGDLAALECQLMQKSQYFEAESSLATMDFKKIQGYSVHRDFLCHLCKQAIASMVSYPCRHLSLCNMCLKLASGAGLRACLSCQTRVEYVSRIKYSPDSDSPI